MATYTHVGRRFYTGHYAVTADASRKPGRTHAFNMAGSAAKYGAFAALCGEVVPEFSDDHFSRGNRQVVPDDGRRITCKRCRKMLAKAAR